MRSCLHHFNVSGCDGAVSNSAPIEADFAATSVSVSVAGNSVCGEESLEDLALLLRRRIGESDWLEQQTLALVKSKSGTY